jgi:hypothetical protein
LCSSQPNRRRGTRTPITCAADSHVVGGLYILCTSVCTNTSARGVGR